MDPWIQWLLTLALPTLGAYVGSRVSVAKLEVRVDHHHEKLKEIEITVREHEGTLNSHSIQLAVMDGPRTGK